MEEKMKILIVDDNIELANALKDAINNYNENWTAEAVYNGNDAINTIPLSPPDIVFSDIVLPDMSGIEVMKSIKEVEQDIQVILMTAYASLSTAIEAIQYGAYDYIPKPLHINQVINAIESAAKRRKSLLENRKVVASLLRIKEESKAKGDAREIIERLMILRQFQKKLSSAPAKKKLLEVTYKEFSKIFTTQTVFIFLKNEKDEFYTAAGPKNSLYTIGEKIDSRMPFFYLPVKSGMGCVFTGEKTMVSVMGYDNRMVGLVYFKRETDFSQGDLEIAEMLSLEMAAKMTEILLNKKLDTERMGIIYALMSLLGVNDPEYRSKVERVSGLAVDFSEYVLLNQTEIENVKYASIMYNIIETSYAKKAKKKSEIIEKLTSVVKELEFLNNAKDALDSVNENYDGSGKPQGLKREDIPLGSRIIKLAATFDLLVSEKKYRKGETVENSLKSIVEKRGKYFDPRMTDAFVEFVRKNPSRFEAE